MSLHLDLHLHITFTKPDYPNACPKGLVVRHPLVKVPDHSRQRFVIQRNMVGIDPEHLLPALAARLLEDMVDVGKGLVDLILNIFVDYAGLVYPATLDGMFMSAQSGLLLVTIRMGKIERTLA